MQTEQRLADAVPRALARASERTERLSGRMGEVGARLTRPAEATLARLAAQLDALSPLAVLARGYAIARGADGHVLRDATSLAPGDEVHVLLGSGSFDAAVTATATEGRPAPERS